MNDTTRSGARNRTADRPFRADPKDKGADRTSDRADRTGDRADRTGDRLLMLLKTRGALTTRALAEALEISVPAVRQHLQARRELVDCETVRQGVGRPAQAWRLSAAGQARFPDTHAELTVRLIGFIDNLGPDALDGVLEQSYRYQLDRYRERLAVCRSLGERVRRLAAMRREEGYMAEATRDGRAWLLVEHHCPICAAATACRGFCRNELALFRNVLPGARVERTEYLLDGGQRCAYRIESAD